MLETFLTRRNLIIIFLIVVAAGLRFEHNVLFYDLGHDKSYQMSAAARFAEGKGITYCIATAEDLANVTCSQQTWWAVGYPVIIGTLYKITDDLILADWILYFVGLATFLFASFRIFSLWSEARMPFGFFLIFVGFSFTPFKYFQTNDLVSTAFLMLAISEASYAVKQRRGDGFILSGLAIFAAAFFKFSFYPFLALAPASLVIMALIRRDAAYLKYIIFLLVPIAACFLVLMAVAPDYILPPERMWIRVWNWYNVAAQDPFGVRALFFIDFIVRRLDKSSPVGLLIFAVLQAFSFGIAGGFVYMGTRYVSREYRSPICDGRTLSIILGIVTLGITLAYLNWLSLRLPTFYLRDATQFALYGTPDLIYIPWTFVQETRYYGPTMVLILYSVFILPAHIGNRSVRIASLALACSVLSYSVLYWTGKHFDMFYNGRIEGSFASYQKDNEIVAQFLKNDRMLDRGKTVLGFISHAGGYGYPTVLVETDPRVNPFPWYEWSVRDLPIRTSQSSNLLVTIHKSPTDADQALLAQHNGIRILELTGYDLYRLEILPSGSP